MLNKSFLPATVIGLIFLFLIARGCGSSEQERLSYRDVGVGVSQYSSATVNGVELDLSADLDPSQVPAIVESAYKDGARLKKEGKELLSFVIQDVSQKVSSISTIDLNENQVPDPILIVPEGDQERMTFSIRVPDPIQVPTYPDSADGWQQVAENKAVEVMAVTVFPRLVGGKLDRFDVEAKPNQQLYESSHHHHYHGSFSSGYFTGMMMSSLFFNPYRGWYGPGFYGNMGYYNSGYYNRNYGGRSVDSTRTTRTTYKKAATSSKPMTTASGKSVSSKLSGQKSSSVSQFKSSAIAKRDTSKVKKASGFGSSKSTASSSTKPKSSWGKSSSSSSSSWGKSSSSSSSWGRSSGRSSWGGGGSRGGK
jgi:uncharacterized membrane protein YgcG